MEVLGNDWHNLKYNDYETELFKLDTRCIYGTMFIGKLGTDFFDYFQWIDNAQPTGIKTMAGVRSQMDVWYDLSGRKLTGRPTTKGIYILSGKKIVIK